MRLFFLGGAHKKVGADLFVYPKYEQMFVRLLTST